MIFGRIYERIVNLSINKDVSLLDIEDNVKKVKKTPTLRLTKSKTNLVHARGNVFPYNSYDMDKVNISIDKFIAS